MRYLLCILLAGCTSPRTLRLPDAAIDIESGPDSQLAALDGQGHNPSMSLGERDGDSQGDHPVSPEPQDSAPAGDGPVAGIIPKDASSSGTMCDKTCPVQSVDEAGVCMNGQCKFYCFAPLANCSGSLNSHARCFQPAICLVAAESGFFNTISHDSFCSTLINPSISPKGAWGPADNYGDCTSFFTQHIPAFCGSNKVVETRRWSFDSQGKFSSETINPVKCGSQ